MADKDTTIYPAATVVLLRDAEQGLETLLLRRNSKLAFAGGSWVFPGGRIDAEDYQGCADDDQFAAARKASVRETAEEAGLCVDGDSMVYYAHWTTPPVMPKRFATWFFMTDVSENCGDVKVDGGEIHEHIWSTPTAALEAHREKQIELMPPTFVALTELKSFDHAVDAIRFFGARESRVYEPRFAKTDSGMVALYSGDAGYETSDASVDGGRHRCLMFDGGWTYEDGDA